MMVYVSHRYDGKYETTDNARRILKRLQAEYPTDCFICPIFAFSHLGNKEMTFEQRRELRRDLISVFDYMIVASDEDEYVIEDIEFANLIGMEVEYIEPSNSR